MYECVLAPFMHAAIHSLALGLDLGNSVDQRERESAPALIYCTRAAELQKKKKARAQTLQYSTFIYR